MTKFLNESGFRRIVKAIKDALAGKQDKKLVVTVTGVGGDNITADKTYNEILAAYNSGADILVDDGYGYFYHLIAFDSGWFVFMMKPHDEENADYYLLVSPQNVWTSRTWEAQEKLVSGTNIKTINNTSLLGSGNISIEPNEIASITTTESTASGGNNTVTINTTDGTSKTFNVKNGKDGKDGQDGADGVSLGEVALVQTTGDSEESVMSQKAVTEYGRKVTAEDLNGTSEWIREKLTEEGWEFGKELTATGGLTGNAETCVTDFIPLQNFSSRDEHQLIICTNVFNMSVCFYDENKSFKNYYSIQNIKTVIPTSAIYQNSYIRLTLNPNQIAESYIKDDTSKEYLWEGSKYLSLLCKAGVLAEGFHEDNVLKTGVISEELRDSTIISSNEFAWHKGDIDDITGESIDSDSVCRSRFIEIPNNCDKIIINNGGNGYNVYAYLYDKNKEFVGSLGTIYRTIKYVNKDDYSNVFYIRFKGTNSPIYVHTREYNAVSLIFKNSKKKTERSVLVAKGLDQHSLVYFKLNKSQVDLINSSDVISVLWVVGSGQDRNDYNRYFMPFYSSDSDTLRIGHASSGAISKVNSTSAGNTNIAGTEHHGVCGLSVNRKTGEVKYYDRGRYVTTFTDSSFVLSKFVSNDGVFYINNASTNGAHFSILYNLSLYIGDVFDLLINSSDWLSMLDSIDGAHLCFAGVNKYNEIGRLNYDRQPIWYGMLGTKSGTTYTVSTLPASTSKFMFASYSQPPYLRKYTKYLQITQGVARFPAFTSTNATQKLYNSNSSWEKLSEVSDYENVGVGYYILEDYGGSDLKMADGDMRVVEVPFTVDVAGGQSTEQPWGCVANFKFDTLIDGKLYDEVTDQYYTAYSDAECNNPISINLSSVPFKKYCMFNKSTPTFVGELKIYDGKIYVAQDMNTWKQINNS